MVIREIDLPEELDSSMMKVEVDRISSSGTPIAYPVKEKYQGLFVGEDGIHLPEGEPGEVLDVQIMDWSKSWAAARLTKSEQERRRDEEDADTQAEDEFDLEEWKQQIAEKRKKAEEANEEFREEISEEIPEDALSESIDSESKELLEDVSDEEWEKRQSSLRENLTGGQ